MREKNQIKIFMIRVNCNIHLILLGFFLGEKRVKMQRKIVQNVHDRGRDMVLRFKAIVLSLQLW